ncbi:hypothetical protein EJ419_05025 [Alloscardovia theropitheci]|uniref:Putative T7SS secretion signal domain-containing protein n=1 Tax=Alloscardovia theropitheci TaxID=2496842 RepID=A0A4R0QRN3_9BIFI|nr:hypothetical protein [Alloscardovia theropitheci]TCD54028.1 hypothetical protein EJ419_05025 [Alloscardovia theropitheci]
MVRPDVTDWFKVGYDGDQVPGDSESIAALASKFGVNAQNFDKLSELLGQVASSSADGAIWTGKGADEFHSKYDDFASKVSKLATSLRTVKTELDSFATSVGENQVKADAALRDAVAAKG